MGKSCILTWGHAIIIIMQLHFPCNIGSKSILECVLVYMHMCTSLVVATMKLESQKWTSLGPGDRQTQWDNYSQQCTESAKTHTHQHTQLPSLLFVHSMWWGSIDTQHHGPNLCEQNGAEPWSNHLKVHFPKSMGRCTMLFHSMVLCNLR